VAPGPPRPPWRSLRCCSDCSWRSSRPLPWQPCARPSTSWGDAAVHLGRTPKHTLAMGWSSCGLIGATAGDVAKDVACEWLRSAGQTPDVAVLSPGCPRERFIQAAACLGR
jgi:hypothetical protein